jgi:hypothetical protein
MMIASALKGRIIDAKKANDSRCYKAANGRGGQTSAGTVSRGSGGCHSQYSLDELVTPFISNVSRAMHPTNEEICLVDLGQMFSDYY